ncbi:MAG: TIGR00341 family protein [Odoribacter sp.]|nr:TIGR00341 family protein [Odoribacter sp.]
MNNFLNRMSEVLVNYFTLTPYIVSQREAEQSIREGVSFRGTNMVILILAILIASLGLNTNSTAVIIGAMLISPLMGPIIGLGLGIGIQDFDLLKKSLRNLAMAALFSIVASTFYFVISPVSEGHSELLARTQPTIYDVLIGFVGGGAGIVAICSRSKGNVIPGVAIATALMPPLCTVGYGLATWQPYYFMGALYLFLINSIFICLATFIGIKMMKFKPAVTTDPLRARRVRRWVYTLSILCLLPSIYLTYSMLRQSRFEINAGRFVTEECHFTDTHVLSSNAQWSRTTPTITITLIGAPLPQDSLQLALAAQLRHYGLAGTHLNIIQGSAVVNSSMPASSVRDIYEMSQAAISQKQATIDSLRQIITLTNAADALAADIIPELKVIFPQIEALSVSRNIFARVKGEGLDTVHLALVNFSKPMTRTSRDELSRYLEARLKINKVKIVEIPADDI